MDYIDIILKGYTNENDRLFLSRYFVREQKRALTEHYTSEEFFSGLNNGLQRLKQVCENQFFDRQNELYLMLDKVNDKSLKYDDLRGLDIEENYKKTIEYCNTQLKTICANNYSVNLLGYGNNQYRGHLFFNELILIGNEIKKAIEETNEPQIITNLKKTTHSKKTKNTFTDFLDNVRTGNVPNIEIENYIFKISKKHKTDKLETILKDIEFYLFVESDLLNSKITKTDWDKIHLQYQNRGEKLPFERIENTIQKALDKKNNTLSNDPYFYFCNDYNLEKLFYPHEFFCIYQLENYIKSLILPIQKTTSKHENIFSNNGFLLFEYLLNNHIRPKGTIGRFADISDYYWKMYDSDTPYIHQRPARFKEWFFTTYDKEDIGKIKTADNLKDIDRDKHYSNSLDWFKTHN